MNEGAKRELTRQIEGGAENSAELIELRQLIEEQDSRQFYPPNHRDLWKVALNMGWESRMREAREDHRALNREGLQEFEMFRNDVEALTKSELKQDRELGRFFLPDSANRWCDDEGGEPFCSDEPLPEDFVLGEILHRFKTNDVKFFRALTKLVEARANPEPKKSITGHAAQIAFNLGIQLQRNPTYSEALAAIREAGFEVSKSDESAMMNRCGLNFLKHRGSR